MNKTLLLILVDFLLLNLLALTRWEKTPEQKEVTSTSTPAQTVQRVVEEDLVGALKSTLEEERQAREAIREELASAQSEIDRRNETLAEREARLAAMQQDLQRKQDEAARLAERVSDTQAAVSQLSDRLSDAARDAASSKSQAEQLAKELAERQKAAAELNAQVDQLNRQRAESQQQIQTLNTQLQVGETERTFLRESVDTLRTQVTAEREEKLKLQEHTGVLAEGVTQLAESSASLRKEIRSNTPINANALFDEFLKNRVEVAFHASRDVLIGSGTREAGAKTLLLTDGTNIVALLHVNETVASLREGAPDWRSIEATLAGNAGSSFPVARMFFLKLDPRVMVIPVDAARAAALGVHVYPTALEPFKFPEAVLVKRGGEDYGEVEFKLDPQTPGYVRMNSSILGRLAGRFSPSSGDLVFSKTGELLGIMVNNTYCALVDNFVPGLELPLGTNILEQKTSEISAQQRARVMRLPLRLQ